MELHIYLSPFYPYYLQIEYSICGDKSKRQSRFDCCNCLCKFHPYNFMKALSACFFSAQVRSAQSRKWRKETEKVAELGWRQACSLEMLSLNFGNSWLTGGPSSSYYCSCQTSSSSYKLSNYQIVIHAISNHPQLMVSDVNFDT